MSFGIEEHEGYINTYMARYDVSLNADQFSAMVNLSFNKGPDDALDIIKHTKRMTAGSRKCNTWILTKKILVCKKEEDFKKNFLSIQTNIQRLVSRI